MRNLYTQSVFNAHVPGDPVQISQSCLVLEKLEWWDYHILLLKKVWYVKPLRYNIVAWQTDVQNSCIAILRRDKNESGFPFDKLWFWRGRFLTSIYKPAGDLWASLPYLMYAYWQYAVSSRSLVILRCIFMDCTHYTICQLATSVCQIYKQLYR